MRFGLTAFCTSASLDPAGVARAAERAGFELVLFPDHTHIPHPRRSPYPGGGEMPPFYGDTFDAITACSFALAATSTLHVGIGVCLVPARDPIVLAKQVASLDVLSGGRFVLGVGAGWNREEIADHGVDPSARWDVLRDRVHAMKAIWSRTSDGASEGFVSAHATFGPMQCGPQPLQRPHPPILVGGHGPGVLDRVLDYGDEWLVMPSPGSPPLRDRIAELHRRADLLGRPRPAVSAQVYGLEPPAHVIERYGEAGVSRVDLAVPHGEPSAMLEAIDRLAEVVVRHGGPQLSESPASGTS